MRTMKQQNALLKILLLLTVGKSAVALARQTETTARPDCFQQLGNFTAEGRVNEGIGVNAENKEEKEYLEEEEEDLLQVVKRREIMVGLSSSSHGMRQSNLTRDRQLGEEIEEADDKEEEKDIDRMEEEEDTFQLVDKRAKALIQPRQLCQQK